MRSGAASSLWELVGHAQRGCRSRRLAETDCDFAHFLYARCVDRASEVGAPVSSVRVYVDGGLNNVLYGWPTTTVLRFDGCRFRATREIVLLAWWITAGGDTAHRAWLEIPSDGLTRDARRSGARKVRGRAVYRLIVSDGVGTSLLRRLVLVDPAYLCVLENRWCGNRQVTVAGLEKEFQGEARRLLRRSKQQEKRALR